jgi:hypothetical protein
LFWWGDSWLRSMIISCLSCHPQIACETIYVVDLVKMYEGELKLGTPWRRYFETRKKWTRYKHLEIHPQLSSLPTPPASDQSVMHQISSYPPTHVKVAHRNSLDYPSALSFNFSFLFQESMFDINSKHQLAFEIDALLSLRTIALHGCTKHISTTYQGHVRIMDLYLWNVYDDNI